MVAGASVAIAAGTDTSPPEISVRFTPHDTSIMARAVAISDKNDMQNTSVYAVRRLIHYYQIVRMMIEYFAAIFGHSYKIFYAHAKLAGQIYAGFNREYHADFG